MPPVVTPKPRSTSACARTFAFSTTAFAYSTNAGCEASSAATAIARGRVVVRAALEAGEHRAVDRRGVRLLAEDHAAARAAERLVRRRRDDVGDADRRRMHPGGDEACDVRDVGREDRADLVGDLRGRPRSRACAGTRSCRPRSPSAGARARAFAPRPCRCGGRRGGRRTGTLLKYLPVIETV